MANRTDMLDGGALAARTLREAGVEVVFALHGGHLDTFLTGCRRYGIRLVDCRHEAAAVNAADGYARSTGRLGVAAVTSGPGLFNSIGGISAAAADGVGVLVITSSPPLGEAETRELQGGLDQIAAVRPITKWAHRVTSTSRIPDLVGLAVRHAQGGQPGPVVLDIPIDVGFTSVDPSKLAAAGKPEIAPRPVPPTRSIASLAELIDASERPVVVVGDGSLAMDFRSELDDFAEATGIPVFRSGLSRGGLSRGHKLNAGGIFSLMALPALGAGTPDLVILVGASHGLFLGGRRFYPMCAGAKMAQIHLDAAEIGRLGPVDVGVVGDIGPALTAVSAAVAPTDRSAWAGTAVAMKNFASSLYEGAAMEDDGIHPFRIAADIAAEIEPGTILVRDGGEAAQWMDWATGDLDLTADLGLGFQGHLGVGQGYSIGAQIAYPERRVVQVVGDGAIGFHIQEWDTMVRHKLPIVTVVFNNSCWGMSIHGQHAVYGPEGDVISRLAPTRYDLVAEGFGAFGQNVTDVAELRPAIKRAMEAGTTAVVNVATSATIVHPVTATLLGSVSPDDEVVVPYYDNIPK